MTWYSLIEISEDTSWVNPSRDGTSRSFMTRYVRLVHSLITRGHEVLKSPETYDNRVPKNLAVGDSRGLTALESFYELSENFGINFRMIRKANPQNEKDLTRVI
jgi:hypothetical protein